MEFVAQEGFSVNYVYLDRIRGEIRKHVANDLERRRGNRLIYPILEVEGSYLFGFDPEVWRKAIRAAEADGTAQ
jgi:hypothetical protein